MLGIFLANLVVTISEFQVTLSQDIYPVSHNPDDIQFLFFNDRVNLNTSHEITYLNVQSLYAAGLKTNTTTVLYIHGYYDDATDEQTAALVKNAYLKSGTNANIIIVNWVKLARPEGNMTLPQFAIGYVEVVFNIPIAGERVYQFVQWLLNLGIISTPKQIHLIGHSLGCHISGYAGKRYKQQNGKTNKIGRITGLDPAQPLIQFPIQLVHKLSYKDACFVDIIHTNLALFGDATEDGHVDFYPNGGGPFQPGCFNIDIFEAISCSHIFCNRLYAASFFTNMVACSCPFGRITSCLSPCDKPVVMGVHVPYSARGKYFLLTSSNPPDTGPPS